MALNIYLKPTNFCNVGCDHCYLPEETRADKQTMTEETLIDVCTLVKNLAARENHGSIHFVWHGGEPMVLSPKYYEAAFKVMDREIGERFYTSSLQTSLIPYRETWNSLIESRFDGCIGTSIDFSQRTVAGSAEEYIDLWMSKVSLARDSGFLVIPGVVPTRNEVDHAEEMMRWFFNNGFQFFNIDRFSRYGNEKNISWPTNKEHSRFLIGLFDSAMQILKSGRIPPYVNVLIAGINGVINNLPGDRWGTQCQREFLVIEPDGSINSCPDRAMHEAPHSNASLGIDALQASPERRKWIRIMNVDHQKDHCNSCEFNSFCRSGCPVTPNGPSEGQSECSGYKSFLLHVRDFYRSTKENASLVEKYMYSNTMIPVVSESSIG